MTRRIIRLVSVCLLAVFMFTGYFPVKTRASLINNNRRIIVSLGDSYSSGEGIEPFYGQDLPLEERVHDQDWLAHRSRRAWSGRIGFNGHRRTLNEDWFFVAASGATTINLWEEQKKEYDVGSLQGEEYLPPQLDVFNRLNGQSPDYVTMTMGGNDVGFEEIIRTAATSTIYLAPTKLYDQLNHAWSIFFMDDGTADRLHSAYLDIANRAGPNCAIIIAGYPRLLDPRGDGVFFSEVECELINENVEMFNNAIEEIVDECYGEGMNIYFVSVWDEFEGHEAYSDDTEYINGVICFAQEQDLKSGHFIDLISAYSMHPNEYGSNAYLDCVQAKINELEELRNANSTLPTYAPPTDCIPEGKNPIAETYNIGDVISFGYYNGEPLLWTVVDFDSENEAMLITANQIVRQMEFHHGGMLTEWDESDVRAWLNGDFYNTAFIEQERVLIHPVIHDTDYEFVSYDAEGNVIDSVEISYEVEDSVFILSCPEAETYFDTPESRIRTYEGIPCEWWSRSTGSIGGMWNIVYYYYTYDGYNSGWGTSSQNMYGVCPALWVRNSCEEIEACNAYRNENITYNSGDTLTFGTYNGEPIQWTVLDVQDDRALVISTDILFHARWGEGNTWDTSTLRTNLNNEFLNSAFSPEEQARILNTLVYAEANPEFDYSPGNDTYDYLFLLSISEVNQYFPYPQDRLAISPDFNYNTEFWWLRNPNNFHGACVEFDGTIGSEAPASHDMSGVRPAMWIDISR